ncbi:MAG: dephospho-CoA kinase [candidate division Zixibacteria bacterium]|nr:dephospho-CoA kinase [candidate division Zixibacteria bacterium]
MLKLGVTGQIASGKSTVAEAFAEFGGRLVSADQIGREVVEKNKPVLSKLIRAFGRGIVTAEGQLKRRELGKIVFASPEKRKTLNEIVHPQLLKRLVEEIKVCESDPKCGFVIVDAALLVDWGWHEKVDYTICVTAPEADQITRAVKNGFTVAEIKDRISSQKPIEDLVAVSDFVIHNNGTLSELRDKTRQVYERIKVARKS